MAVLAFRNDGGRTDEFGRFLADTLSTQLIETGRFQVVERSRIDSILEELRLGDEEEQVVDPKFAARFRGLSGAEYVIVGSLFYARDHVALNVRVLHTLTGAARAGSSVTFRLGADGKPERGDEMSRTQSTAGVNLTLRNCQAFNLDVLCIADLTWTGPTGRLAVLPGTSVGVLGARTAAESLTLQDVSVPGRVNASFVVPQNGTVVAAARFPRVLRTSRILDSVVFRVQTPSGETAAFEFLRVAVGR
ncbi:MAG: hypothetical protein HYU53_13350 [Acidobacteria bacterium]|nr:hypothetical protein [Acidobacteriota bacterium]